MSTFENFKTLQFSFNNETVKWQLQLLPCFSFVRCHHPFFIKRFGHANIITRAFDGMFGDISETDEDYSFFEALQKSAENKGN